MTDEQIWPAIKGAAESAAAAVIISKTLLAALAMQPSLDRSALRRDILVGLESFDAQATSSVIQTVLLEFSKQVDRLAVPDE